MVMNQVALRKLIVKPMTRIWDLNKNKIENQVPKNTIPVEAVLSITGKTDKSDLKDELESLQKKDAGLARVYEDALKNYLAQAAPSELDKRWSRNILLKLAKRACREAVYEHLGIKMKKISPEVAKRFGNEELIDRKELFDMVVFGNAKKHILNMTGAGKNTVIEFDKVYASIGIYRTSVAINGSNKYIYVKEAGGEPDMLAKELLNEAGVTTPKIMNVRFKMSYGTVSEYSVMKDIADAQDVDRAVSLRALARDEKMSAFVLSNLDEFWKKLGYAFEACRMLGIQDRHNRNVFVLRKKDGSLSIGMIDLDIVACYSPNESYMQAYAGQFHWISSSIDFVREFGVYVRAAPLQIKEMLAWDLPESARSRMVEAMEKGFGRFLEGAAIANEHYRKASTQKLIKKIMMRFDGKPVGWGCSENSLRELEIKRKKTVALLNGNIQSLMSTGPNRGRFKLASDDAWEQGFKRQLDSKSDGFWTQMAEYWKGQLLDWIPETGGALGRITTIAY